MSIYHPVEKINPVKDREGSQRPSVFNGVKHFVESEKGKDILVILIVILVGLGSFELGRLSKNTPSSGIKVTYPDKVETQTANTLEALNSTKMTTDTQSKTFFASSRGSRYYSVGCAAGKTIKQENRIYFNTKEEAERAGYVLSSSCR